jgi:hypothetical protein
MLVCDSPLAQRQKKTTNPSKMKRMNMNDPEKHLPEQVVPFDYATPASPVGSFLIRIAIVIGIFCWFGFAGMDFIASHAGPGDNGGAAMAMAVPAVLLYLLSLVGLVLAIVGFVKTLRRLAIVAFLLNVAPTIYLLIALSQAF